MIQTRYILLALLLCACGGPAPAISAPPAMGDTAKVQDTVVKESSNERWTLRTDEKARLLRGKMDIVARIVPVQSKSNPTGSYLVQLQDASKELDGLVLLTTKVNHQINAHYRGKAYRVIFKGAPLRVILASQKKGWALWRYGPDLVLTPDEGAQVDGAALVALHHEQLSSGALDKVSPEGRKGREEFRTQAFDASMEEAVAACGIPAKINWSTVEDEWFDNMDLAITCETHLKPIAKFCRAHPHLREELKKLGKIECRFRGMPEEVVGGVSKGDGGIIIVPGGRPNDPEGSGERLTVYSELQTLFGEDEQVLRNGERYIVLRKHGGDVEVYAGTRGKLAPQRILGATFDRGRGHLVLWGAGLYADIRLSSGKWTLRCGEDSKSFETVVGKERKQILASAKFAAEPVWTREPYYLGRDSRGEYYYVDKLRDEFGGKRHRVFVGRRGQAKITPLVGLVEDSQGMLFSTKAGNLRLVIDGKGLSKEATWIRGKKHNKLTSVPVQKNYKLIYQSLGAYFGERMGDVCGN